MSSYTIVIQSLKQSLLDLDALYQQVVGVPPATDYTLDLRNVRFLHPYELLALVISTRYLSQKCSQPVQITNVAEKLLLYLERMDLFTTGREWLELKDALPEQRWDRTPDTGNLLELTTIRNNEDVISVVARTKRICEPLRLPGLSKILGTLSELCSNAWEHSGDNQGCALIQRYYHQKFRETNICIAIGDMGRGIRGSLVERYGEFEEYPVDYLIAALNGKTSRASGRGGSGLSSIEATVMHDGGHLWIRSDTAAIFSRGPHQRRKSSSLTPLPGTQVVVELTSHN